MPQIDLIATIEVRPDVLGVAAALLLEYGEAVRALSAGQLVRVAVPVTAEPDELEVAPRLRARIRSGRDLRGAWKSGWVPGRGPRYLELPAQPFVGQLHQSSVPVGGHDGDHVGMGTRVRAAGHDERLFTGSKDGGLAVLEARIGAGCLTGQDQSLQRGEDAWHVE